MTRLWPLTMRLCLVVCALAAGTVIRAQSTNLIAGVRQPGGTSTIPNPMWAAAGVKDGIPVIGNQCGSTLAASSSAAAINTAISNCANAGGGYVGLASGTFNLSGAINLKSNVVLRGAGMGTILNITSTSGSSWQWGGGEGALTMIGAYTAVDGVPPIATVPSTTFRNWSGTNGQTNVYTSGATVVNLATAPTGLAVGDTLVLWQSDELDGNLPMPGFFLSDKTGGSGAISWQGAYDDHNAAMEQRSTVVAINGNAVTIDPGLVHPTGTWKASLTPRAGWLKVSQTIHDAGVENLLLQTTGMGRHNCDVCIAFANDVWVKGVGMRPKFTGFHQGGAVDYGITIQDSYRVTVRDNWLDKMIGGGFFTTTSYGVSTKEAHHVLVENNVFNNVEAPITINIGTLGSVFSYNYERYVGDGQQEGGIEHHEVGASMNLFEGNRAYKETSDVFHGNTGLETFFRNHMDDRGFDLWAYHRWYNLIGNVIDATDVRKTLSTDGTKYDRWAKYAFRLGYNTQAASIDPNYNGAGLQGVSNDTVVHTSTMIWGNYSTVGGTVFSAAEVPSNDPVFPNPVPANQNLPASLYSPIKPGFFTITGVGTLPWPLNGPDVSAGTLLAGHANKTPAQTMYDFAGGTLSRFDPRLYGVSATQNSPAAPTNLRVLTP